MTAPGRFGRLGGFVFAMVVLTLFLAGCEAAKNQLKLDRAAEMDGQQYRDALAPMPPPPAEAAPAPEFQSVVSTPEDLRLPSPLVTVAVNQTVGLRDLLYQLAQQADVDLEMDPQIHGTLIFTAKERPFDEVIQRISEMAGLRYKYANNVLRVELDRPFVKGYNVGFLNVERKGDTKISVTSSSSSGTVDNKMENDVWKELHDGIEQVLAASDTYISLATLADPAAVPVNPNPPPMPVQDPNQPPPPPPAPGSPQVSPMPAAATPQLNITTPPAEPLVPNPPATFSISKQSGNVSVFASERQQKQVAKFIDEFRKRVMTQVLIETKVLQVDLNDEYTAGIDWKNFDLTGLANVASTFSLPNLTSGNATGSFALTFNPRNDFTTIIKAMSRFGTVRALSSPRVTVMNNQPAVVNVAKDNVYFNFTATVTPATTTSGATATVTGTQKNAPEGVILTVVPNANSDTGEIAMVVRPTVSKVIGHVTDPTISLTLALNNFTLPAGTSLPDNEIPELSVQEIDSILHMQSGQMMALGGLMKDQNITQEDGVPVAKDIPMVGNLFKNHVDQIVKSELVLLIKATIVPGGNIDDNERKIYQVFSLDRHPSNL